MPILIQNRRRHPRLTTPQLRRFVQTILEGLDLGAAEVSVVLTDDAALRQLNKDWRDKDSSTDVLSFPQYEAEEIDEYRQASAGGAQLLLGDVVISADTAARQATSAGVPFSQEMMRLLIHGVLHLLGHDHVAGGQQERRMQEEEKRLYALLEARTAVE